ncbi:MAG TPA: methyltransferase domain-containing protein [Acidimicrobiales bacterium]|nr:methyltransferase domain-containing protein [Acidimicrobiales bacterium]
MTPAEAPRYERIGVGYARRRQPDPRIARQIHGHLGSPAERPHVLNVGAGAGSYEPGDRRVTAVEPSPTMIAQRPASVTAEVVRAVGGALPFPNGTFDATTALLTVQHWPDIAAGLAEVRRVTTGPIVVFTFDYDVHATQWLVDDYFPEMLQFDHHLPAPAELAEHLGCGAVEVVPIPHDCVDGFMHAWWRRPEAYLEPDVRAAISGLARLADDVVAVGVERLRADLAPGAWADRHADLLDRTELDTGYRLVISPDH